MVTSSVVIVVSRGIFVELDRIAVWLADTECSAGRLDAGSGENTGGLTTIGEGGSLSRVKNPKMPSPLPVTTVQDT